MRRTSGWIGELLAMLAIGNVAIAQDGAGTVKLTVVEKNSAEPIPCRVHLQDKSGKPQRADRLPFWHDHFVCAGTAQLNLAPGEYTYEVERGPEYKMGTGRFTVTDKAAGEIRVELDRLANLAKEGWWSGELHVHRPVADIELLMRAEDLHIAPVITWWNNQNPWGKQKRLPDNPLTRFDENRYYHALAGEDEREGGALLYFNLRQPLALAGSGREYPSPMKFVTKARRQPDVWIDVEKPFWWDVPIWLASGQVDSIGLANNHMCRSRMYESEAWGKPRDVERLPPPRGNGLWSQEIYYHVLNCGLRLPPSAGSASGVLPNPVGYNRVYVRVGKEFSYEKWWQGLRAGRCFVTNGPLLRVQVDGQLPGHVFRVPQGKETELEVKCALSSRDRIRSLEIIQNGRIEQAVANGERIENGVLGRVRFRESGWFLVRALAENPDTFRFASTAPYYVEIGDVKHRVSRSSARFFLDWVQERADRVRLDDPTQRREVLLYHERARKFWEGILAHANAD
jgi:hypothetical protein